MRLVIGSSLKFRALVVAIAAGLMVFGVAQLRNTPVDVLPEFTPPYVEIQTEALGLSATEVEDLITTPMEADLLNGVGGLHTIRSKSIPGLSSIVLVFERGTDIMGARQLVQERLIGVRALPNVAKAPVMLQPLSSTSRVIMIGLDSSELSPIQRSILARWTIRPRLMGVPGVANVAIWGQREQQMQVQVDPERLRERGVTLDQVIRTTGNAQFVSPLSFLKASTPGAGGFIDTPNQRLQVRHVLPIATPAALSRVPLEDTGGKLALGDVAKVVEDHQPLIGDAVVNDGDGLLLVVEKLPGANTLAVTRGVDEALAALRPGLSGMEVDPSIFRPATFIQEAIDNLGLALLIGGGLLALFLVAFLFEWRTVVVSLAAMALSLVAAGLVIALRGATMNAVLLAGLVVAVGIVVDDAVADTENIWRHLRRRRSEGSGQSTAAIVLEGALEIRRPLVYATLIVLLALLPVLFLEGVAGEFFEPLAVSYALAALASMAVALTVTPALSLLLVPKGLDHRASPVARRLKRRYRAALAKVIQRPGRVLAAVAVVALVGLAAAPALGGPLLPSFKERDLLIRVEGAPGTSRPEINRVAARVSRELRALPGVRDVGGHVGRAVTSDQVVGINSGEIWVSIDPGADYDVTTASIRRVVAGYPGLDSDVLTYSEQRIRDIGAVQGGEQAQSEGTDVVEVLRGVADEPIVVRVYGGTDENVLRAKADEVKRLLSKVDGVVDPQVELPVEEPILSIEVELAAARRYGIKPGDVRRAASFLVQGIQVGALFERQKVFDVVVVGTPDTRHSVNSVRNLLVDTPGGGRVRLDEVADVSMVSSPNSIKREAVSRHIDVGAGISGRDLGPIADDIERRLRDVSFPLEYHAEVLESSTEREPGPGWFIGVVIAAALGIVLLLQAALGRWPLALAFALVLPVALVGGALAAWADGGAISVGSLMGFLTVFAIAVRNGVVLISHYQELERSEDEPVGTGLILRGARERAPHILLTALGTGLLILPLVLFGSIAGYELVHPAAVVILGGLVTSTLLTLFVVPSLYFRFGLGSAPDTMPDIGRIVTASDSKPSRNGAREGEPEPASPPVTASGTAGPASTVPADGAGT